MNSIHLTKALLISSSNIQQDLENQTSNILDHRKTHHPIHSHQTMNHTTAKLNREENQLQQNQFHHQHPQQQQRQHHHQTKQVDQSFQNTPFPQDLSFNSFDPTSLLQTDSILKSLQSHDPQELLDFVDLQGESGNLSEQLFQPQHQSITSKDQHQPNPKKITTEQQPPGVIMYSRTKSNSLSPTASNFSPITNSIAKSYQHGNGTSEFIKKLYKMLEEPESESVVGWGRQKTTLVIKDQILFQKDILPKHFKHSNFASFVRQLNKYDFRKFKPQSCSSSGNKNPEQQSSSTQNPAPLQWEFYHPHFRADTLSELDNIKRKVPAARQKPMEHSLHTSDYPSGAGTAEPTVAIVNRLMKLQQKTTSALNHLTQENKILREELKQAHRRLDLHQLEINLLNAPRNFSHQSSQFPLELVSQSSANIQSPSNDNNDKIVSLPNIQEQVKYNEPGMNDCLPKPFTKEGMIVMLQKHLFHPFKRINIVNENTNHDLISTSHSEKRDLGQSSTSPSPSPRPSFQLQNLQQPLTSSRSNDPPCSHLLDANQNRKRPCIQQPIDFNFDDYLDKEVDTNLLNFDFTDPRPDLHLYQIHQNLNHSPEGTCKKFRV